MAEVKWIKITTNMFEDEKIDFIESLPESDAILVIWIKLLAQAGKSNMNGFIFLTESIPYTEEMLSHKFRRPLNTVKLALGTLKQLEMIEYDDEGFMKISNWEKHQNVEGLDKIREQTRLRVAKHREKQKALEGSQSSNVTVTLRNGTEEELEEELDIDIDTTTRTTLTKKDINLIIEEWNKLELQNLRSINSNTKRHTSLKARIKEYSLEEVVQAIKSINESSFLKGQNNRGWTITFDWLVKPNNFVKVIEGNYLDKGDSNGANTTGNGKKNNEDEIDWAARAGIQSF